ncbi:hypothetical protein BT67DRAFT_14708 [Trichocladium antarcticum]|uniref:Uncharacterized protein n=1 Tax=Trichocladium antarcticum TaxID=1450529 RepID=A0AAN6UTL0_9PEZI|nr:hypothetical protein BT67DRAFT_14708 [Trichocladium antarcticum]
MMNIISFGLISETMNGVVCRFNSKLATSSVQLGFTAEGMYPGSAAFPHPMTLQPGSRRTLYRLSAPRGCYHGTTLEVGDQLAGGYLQSSFSMVFAAACLRLSQLRTLIFSGRSRCDPACAGRNSRRKTGARNFKMVSSTGMQNSNCDTP